MEKNKPRTFFLLTKLWIYFQIPMIYCLNEKMENVSWFIWYIYTGCVLCTVHNFEICFVMMFCVKSFYEYVIANSSLSRYRELRILRFMPSVIYIIRNNCKMKFPISLNVCPDLYLKMVYWIRPHWSWKGLILHLIEKNSWISTRKITRQLPIWSDWVFPSQRTQYSISLYIIEYICRDDRRLHDWAVVFTNPFGWWVVHAILESRIPGLFEDIPLQMRAIMWCMHEEAPVHFRRVARQKQRKLFSFYSTSNIMMQINIWSKFLQLKNNLELANTSTLYDYFQKRYSCVNIFKCDPTIGCRWHTPYKVESW